MQVLEKLRQLGTPVVLDADALWLVTQRPALVAGWRGAVLTPNVAEYRRLAAAVVGAEDASPQVPVFVVDTLLLSNTQALHAALEGPVLVRKGASDEVYAGGAPLVCSAVGSPRRCGGQGDVLSGCLGTMCAWASMADAELAGAAYLACCTARRAAARAFAEHRRSMVTQDVLGELGMAVQELFPV